MSQPTPYERPVGVSSADATPDDGADRLTMRERFDEPLAKATELTRRTLAWFPVRVWRHFLQHNGFLLAASISYQSIFAIFAVLYSAFALTGIWLGGRPVAVDGLITLVNRLIPGLISEHGLVSNDQVHAVAAQSSGTFAVTGVVAFCVAIWTAIGFVTFTRRAVRDIFGLSFDRRNYFLLKARDLVAALLFGLSLLLGVALGTAAAGALDTILSLLGLPDSSLALQLTVKIVSLAVAFAINALALAALVRLLTGASLPWRTIWPGAIIGGAALAVLQVAVGLLFLYSPSNPLLLSFSVFIGFLLWFRLMGIVILVAASWIAVAAADRDIPIQTLSEAEQRIAEHSALLVAARLRVRDARTARAASPWYRRWAANRTVQEAEDEVAKLEASTPPPVRRGILYD